VKEEIGMTNTKKTVSTKRAHISEASNPFSALMGKDTRKKGKGASRAPRSKSAAFHARRQGHQVGGGS
jgi:hypothetical protein